MDVAGHGLLLMAADLGIMVIVRTKIILNLGLQRTASVYGDIAIRNMQCRAGFREDLVVSLQCNVGTGASCNINRILAAFNIDILNGHICSCIIRRINRNCVSCLYRALPLCNHRSLIRHGRATALRYRLPGIVCIYRNAAIFQIPVGGIGCHGQAYAHDQGDHTCCQLFSLHWVSSLFSFFIFTLSPAMKIHSAWQVL